MMKRIFFGVVTVGAAALFAASVYWIWQMGCLARESAETMRSTRVQIERVGAVVNETSEGLRRLEGRLDEWLADKGAHALAGAMAGSFSGQEKPRVATEDAQIEVLLTKLRSSSLTWASADGEKPVLLLFGIVAAKYGMMKRNVTTVDDFIAKVADEDLLGKPLNVKVTGGETMSLQTWLRQQRPASLP